MINSTYKSYDDVQGIVDTLKSDSNYDNLQSPRKSKEYWSDTNFINSLHDRCKKFYAPVTPSSSDQRQRKQKINKESDTTGIRL